MTGFIDIHCHILHGIDDGPASMEESQRMAERAAESGTRKIIATPHVVDGLFENAKETIESLVRQLSFVLPRDLEVLAGADLQIGPRFMERLSQGDFLTLGGSRYLLIEFPHASVPRELAENIIVYLRKRGLCPVISHPERNPAFVESSSLLTCLRKAGAYVQMTAMSLTGGFGRNVEKASFRMISDGLVDFIASDGHDCIGRPPDLNEAYGRVLEVCGFSPAQRLFFDNPEAVVNDREIPHAAA